jgi:uncharacterized Ntn-hydrolase superfamily protein
MAQRFPFAHTYSIVARDPISGEMGAAVQSHWFSTGSIVLWGEAGVGVVATQSMVEASYGPLGLELMRAGKTTSQALQSLLASDEGRELRQVAMLDTLGRVSAHTGARCIPAAGHIVGEGFSVQANMMLNDSVWPAMADAYRTYQGSLTQRLLAALKAAQTSGGDIRGQQSAAILVVKGISSGRSWVDRLVDLRVEDHPAPLDELSRLVDVHSAYTLMNRGDELLALSDIEGALAAYSAAAHLQPNNPEMPFWHAISLAEMGRIDEALPLFTSVFAADPNWRELARRLPGVGLLKVDSASLARILSQ